MGAIYVSEDCQECICTLGGGSFCQLKKCEPCQESETRAIVNELCNCVCKQCPSGTRHCPTSDTCIDENLWCNGLQDCPDDEKDCPESTTQEKTTTMKMETSTPISSTDKLI